MAMIKLAHGLHAINGKRGGNVYREDQCGPHAQAYPRLLDKPPSYLQKEQRGYFAQCVTAWKPLAYTEYMWIWHAWSATHPVTNKKGDYKVLPARQMFFKFNMKRLADGLPIITNPFSMT